MSGMDAETIEEEDRRQIEEQKIQFERFIRQLNDPEYQQRLQEVGQKRVQKLVDKVENSLDDLRHQDLTLMVRLLNFSDDVKVWRRIRVYSYMTLDMLAHIINIAMGWCLEYHAYEFGVHMDGEEEGDRVSVCMDSGAIDMMHMRTPYANARQIAIGSVAPRYYGRYENLKPMVREEYKEWLKDNEKLLPQPDQMLLYTYDLGDGWRHAIYLEKVTRHKDGSVPCSLLDGEGACPPEDARGFQGYRDMMEMLKDPKSDKYEKQEKLEWLETVANIELQDGKLDPHHFDIAQPRAQIKNLAKILQLTDSDNPVASQSHASHSQRYTKPAVPRSVPSRPVVNKKKKKRECDYCGTLAVLKKCGSCKKVRYCNAKCQKADWKSHKKICKRRNKE